MTESVEPQSAVELYLTDRETELSDASIYAHRSHLRHFTEWCDEHGIDELAALTPLKIKEFATWRRETGSVNTVTMNTQLGTVRVFIKWCETINAVRAGLSDAVHVPSLAKGEDERSEMLDAEVADAVIEYLETYEYASRDHVVMLLMWRGLLRRGAVRAIDVDDADLTGEDPSVELKHRPETGTPLKNQYEANRHVALREDTADVIRAYVDHHRHDVTDEHDRAPLLTTTNGRPHVTTIQSTAYAVTRPCSIGVECPHDRDPETCDAARDRQEANKCPSSKGPHAIRRGAITHWLRSDVPDTVIGDRASTSPEVLSTYDERTEEEKMEQRRKYLDDV